METIDKVSQTAHEAYDKISSAGSHAVEVLGEKGSQLKSAEQQLVKNCRGYISDYPIASVGIAAAVGFLLGRLSSHR